MLKVLDQGLSQDLETGCLKLAIVKFWGAKFLRRTTIYSDFNHKHYKFIKIRHDILIQCHGNYMKMKKLKYLFEIDILRNSSQKNLGVLRGAF